MKIRISVSSRTHGDPFTTILLSFKLSFSCREQLGHQHFVVFSLCDAQCSKCDPPSAPQAWEQQELCPAPPPREEFLLNIISLPSGSRKLFPLPHTWCSSCTNNPFIISVILGSLGLFVSLQLLNLSAHTKLCSSPGTSVC